MTGGFKKMPLPVLAVHLTGKFLSGVGLGALLAGYLSKVDWIIGGLVVIVISIIMQIPGAYFALRKK